MNTENTKLSFISSSPFRRAFELIDMGAMHTIAGYITGLKPLVDLHTFDFNYTFVSGLHKGVGFSIHSKYPTHIVLKVTPNRSRLVPHHYNILENTCIEFYITSDEVIVYPLGMYPGCTEFRVYSIREFLRENTFFTSHVAKEISTYISEWNENLVDYLSTSVEGGGNERTIADK